MDGFKTASIDEWNAHCSKPGDDGSTHIKEEGSTGCRICGVAVEFSDLPFHPLKRDGTKGISLLCESCEQKSVGKVKRSSPSRK